MVKGPTVSFFALLLFLLITDFFLFVNPHLSTMPAPFSKLAAVDRLGWVHIFTRCAIRVSRCASKHYAQKRLRLS
jgi:hypothetical protein